MGNYISYFRESIKDSDIKKAKDLLLDLHLESDSTKIAVLDELAMASDEAAWVLLDFLIKLETQHYKSFMFNAYNKLIQLITDRAHLNFDFAMILYKIDDRKKILQAAPLIKYILTNCTDREVLFETINVVGNEKIESLIPTAAEFLYYDDATLKDQAVKNLVKIGTSQVYNILFDISQTVKNDQNIMDSLEILKSQLSTQHSETIENNESINKAETIAGTSDIKEEIKKTHIEKEIQKTQVIEVSPSMSNLNVSVQSDTKIKQAELKQAALKKAENIQTENIEKIEQIQHSTDVVKSSNPDISMLGSKSLEQRFNAFKYFLHSGNVHINELIKNFKSNDHDIIVNTLRIISNNASEDILPDIYSFLNKKQSDPSLEHEAFEALSSFDNFSFTELMMSAVEKPAIHVRMAAIKALDKNYNDPVYAKIKNIIETGREQGLTLAHTIIDAHALNIINYLLVSDTFADIASTYLTKDAAPSALNNYLNILNERGLKSTAKKIEFKADMENRVKNRLKAVVISSSGTVQKIYEKFLFKNGYIAIVFNTPEDAFESISTEKPDLIVSDLFIKDMTALDFAKEIREFYTKNDLPFLISTRQNDFLNINFIESYPESDINAVFKFPAIIKGINELGNSNRA